MAISKVVLAFLSLSLATTSSADLGGKILICPDVSVVTDTGPFPFWITSQIRYRLDGWTVMRMFREVIVVLVFVVCLRWRYGYSKNLKKTVKTGQTRTRERIECTRSERMLSRHEQTSSSYSLLCQSSLVGLTLSSTSLACIADNETLQTQEQRRKNSEKRSGWSPGNKDGSRRARAGKKDESKD
ncbi:hypothetical protein Tco_0680789 [Tanacetum coccineum]|uniref:Uncharacterized protein n=1 Tax=Tanacetum coccineum TaxID=301880 RepID=A0ABQ4XLH6_9ASTR